MLIIGQVGIGIYPEKLEDLFLRFKLGSKGLSRNVDVGGVGFHIYK